VKRRRVGEQKYGLALGLHRRSGEAGPCQSDSHDLHSGKKQSEDVSMRDTLVLGCSIGLAIIFLSFAVAYRVKLTRLKKKLYHARYNLILCRGARSRLQARKNLTLFFDEETNEFKPLSTAMRDTD